MPTPLIRTLALLVLLATPTAALDPGDWIEVRTPHFNLMSDADPERATEIIQSLERFRAVFARLSPNLELVSPAPTRILAFRDAESFAPYKLVRGTRGSQVLGQFLSHSDGNFLALDAGTELVGAYAVVFHEYTHYLVRNNFPGVPLWLNEGLAEYYSTFAGSGRTVEIGLPVERHLAFLAREEEMALDEVLRVHTGSSDYHEGRKAGRFYAVSWLLVHHLLSGSGERLDALADYLLLVREGEDPEIAFADAFGMRPERLEEDLWRHLREGLEGASLDVDSLGASSSAELGALPAAELYGHLGDLLAFAGRSEEAAAHYQLALDHHPEHASALAGLGALRGRQGRFGEAEWFFRDAFASVAPSNALVHLRHGRHLLSVLRAGAEVDGLPSTPDGLAGAARQALRAAVDLDPSFGEAWALYGAAHLVGTVDAEDGLAALARASALLPERTDIVTNRVRLLLRAGQLDRAARLIERDLAQRADFELVSALRDEVERMRFLHAAEAALREGEVEEGLRLYDEAISRTTDAGMRERMEEKLRTLQEQLGGS